MPKPTDQDVVDRIAVGLGTKPEWSSEDLEWIADLIGVVRPHPGDASDSYVEDFQSATNRKPHPAYVTDPEEY